MTTLSTNLENTATFHLSSSLCPSGSSGSSGSSIQRTSTLTQWIVKLLPSWLSTRELLYLTAAKRDFDKKIIWTSHLQTRYGYCLQKIQMVINPKLKRKYIKQHCFEFERINFYIKSDDPDLLVKAIERGCPIVSEWLLQQQKKKHTHFMIVPMRHGKGFI